MYRSAREGTPARTMLTFVALVLVSANLRPAVSSVSPLLGTIQERLGLGAATAGALTTVPVLCMAVFGLVAAQLGERLGSDRVVLWSIVLVALGTLARLAGGVWPLFAATFAIGVGIAVAQTLLPPIVKRRFPNRVGLVSGLYNIGFIIGGAIPALTVVPLSTALGSWHVALSLWAALAIPAVVLWRLAARTDPSSPGPGDDTGDRASKGSIATAVRESFTALPWRSGRAWLISIWYGATSSIYFSVVTWLAPFYVDRGFSPERAGVVLTLYLLMPLATTLLVPALADRARDRRPWFAVSLVALIAGLLLIGLVPVAAAWVWGTLIGVAWGALFPLALTLPLVNAPDATSAGRLTSMTFFVGYLIAAFAPIAVGSLGELAGGYGVVFVALAVVAAAMLVVALVAFGPREARVGAAEREPRGVRAT